MEHKKEIRIPYIEYENKNELDASMQILLEAAEEACHNAYAPYSKFKVGAAILLENGIIVKGNNQENAAYPSGLCAERVAAFAASAVYPNIKFKAIAITAKSELNKLNEPIKPCGACRQVLLEYENLAHSDIKVILSAEGTNIIEIKRIKDLLPLSFDEF